MADGTDFGDRVSDADGVLHVLDVEGYSFEFLPVAGSWFGPGGGANKL